MHLASVVVRKASLDIVLSAATMSAAAAAASCDEGLGDPLVRFSVPWRAPVSNPRRDVLRPLGADAATVRPIRAMPRAKLILSIARARRWANELLSGESDLEALAQAGNCSERRIRQLLPLAHLAPDIVQATMDGRLPGGVGLAQLCALPADRPGQRRRLGL